MISISKTEIYERKWLVKSEEALLCPFVSYYAALKKIWIDIQKCEILSYSKKGERKIYSVLKFHADATYCCLHVEHDELRERQ
jgi:hypothetical protein